MTTTAPTPTTASLASVAATLATKVGRRASLLTQLSTAREELRDARQAKARELADGTALTAQAGDVIRILDDAVAAAESAITLLDGEIAALQREHGHMTLAVSEATERERIQEAAAAADALRESLRTAYASVQPVAERLDAALAAAEAAGRDVERASGKTRALWDAPLRRAVNDHLAPVIVTLESLRYFATGERATASYNAARQPANKGDDLAFR